MSNERPNLVLIMTDQQRGDCLGIDGHPVLQTPSLDSLASSGARFRRGYSECPVCIPARRTLMSGTAPAANGVVGMRSAEWYPQYTLPGVLRDHGYQTELVGKLALWPFNRRFGFDHCEWNEYYDEWLREVHGRTERIDRVQGGGVYSGPRANFLLEEQILTFWQMEQSLKFLRYRDTSAPFFLNISFSAPHPPFLPPQFHYDRYINRELPTPIKGHWVDDFKASFQDPNQPETFRTDYDMQCLRAAYYGMINFVDDQIGRLMNTPQGECTNTMYIFTSDHGEMLGDHEMFSKDRAFESSARVPFIVRPPTSWKLKQGQVYDCPVGLQDIMPTFLDAAGIETPETCTGKSLLPILRGETDTVREVLHGEMGVSRPDRKYHYLTDGKAKYIWYSQTGQEQLFNLQDDPNELRDLAQEPHSDNKLQSWRDCLINILDGRPEGFTDGHRLVKGCPHEPIMPDYDPYQMKKFL